MSDAEELVGPLSDSVTEPVPCEWCAAQATQIAALEEKLAEAERRLRLVGFYGPNGEEVRKWESERAALEAEVGRLKNAQAFNDGLDDSVIRKLRQKVAQAEAERDAATKAWYAASDLVGRIRADLAPFRALVEAFEKCLEAFALTLSESGQHEEHEQQTDPETMCLDCWAVREARDVLADPAVQRAVKEK